jgi:hypothetical protein
MRVRIPPFLLEQLCKGRAGDAAFEPARLVVEALQRLRRNPLDLKRGSALPPGSWSSVI